MTSASQRSRWGSAPAAAILFMLLSTGALPARSQSPDDTLPERLRARVEMAALAGVFTFGEERVWAQVELPRFYERRVFEPAWCDAHTVDPLADSLVSAIEMLAIDGLEPSSYHLASARNLRNRLREGQELTFAQRIEVCVDLDLLLTDAFLVSGAHLLAGQVHPESFDPEWKAVTREADLVKHLEKTLVSGNMAGAFDELRPHHGGYRRLQEALGAYRILAQQGGWPITPDGPTLRLGDESDRVSLLRQRLRVTGDLSSTADAGARTIDEALEEAVRRFQRRHGLAADGVVGPATLGALNVTAEDRVRQIELNLERWRWLPQELGERYLVVNIANFEVDLMESGRQIFSSRVIVGRNYRRTPVFSDRITYLVFCPFWNVPPTIATSDILPAARRDASYFEQKGLRVFSGWGSEARELDPRQIDWNHVSAARFPYRLRQDPGPQNALGSVKFMFPNALNVYLHDTPAREYFGRTERAFSSGCIRVEHALDLAEYLLRERPGWNGARIDSVIASRTEQTVSLLHPLPIHLLYWTAWAEDAGIVQFRNDIYGRDDRLDEALKRAEAEARPKN